MPKVMYDQRWKGRLHLGAGLFAGIVLGSAAIGSLKLAESHHNARAAAIGTEATVASLEDFLRTPDAMIAAMAAIIAADRAENAAIDSRLTALEWQTKRLQTMATLFLEATDASDVR